MGSEGQRLRVIVNRYVKNGLLSLKDLESTVGLPVHQTLSNDYQSVIESLTTGKLLVLNSSCQYARELKELAARIAGKREKAGVGSQPMLKRLLGGAGRSVAKSREALSHV